MWATVLCLFGCLASLDGPLVTNSLFSQTCLSHLLLGVAWAVDSFSRGEGGDVKHTFMGGLADSNRRPLPYGSYLQSMLKLVPWFVVTAGCAFVVVCSPLWLCFNFAGRPFCWFSAGIAPGLCPCSQPPVVVCNSAGRPLCRPPAGSAPGVCAVRGHCGVMPKPYVSLSNFVVVPCYIFSRFLCILLVLDIATATGIIHVHIPHARFICSMLYIVVDNLQNAFPSLWFI